jgi:hypothetical protein
MLQAASFDSPVNAADFGLAAAERAKAKNIGII